MSEAPEEGDADRPALEETRQLLGRQLRVEVQDGRIFKGAFACLDKQGNMILTGAKLVRSKPDSRWVTQARPDWLRVQRLIPLSVS